MVVEEDTSGELPSKGAAAPGDLGAEPKPRHLVQPRVRGWERGARRR